VLDNEDKSIYEKLWWGKKTEVHKKFPEMSRLWQHIAVGNTF
jgi:hypothetical protein